MKYYFEYESKKYRVDRYLANNLATMVYNLKGDWDFVILITGDRMVRTGKSVLGLNVCAFLSFLIKKLGLNNNAFNINNVCMSGDSLMSTAKKIRQYSVLQYDEANEGLSTLKYNRELITFFTECGQLNHIYVIVAPDFFDLKESITVARSEVLLNVYRTEQKKEVDLLGDGDLWPIIEYKREYFQFFNKSQKAFLYDRYKNRRIKNYYMKGTTCMDLFHQYPIDEQKYRELKRQALDDATEKAQSRRSNTDKLRDQLVLELHKQRNNHREISELLESKYSYSITERTVSRIIKGYEGVSGIRQTSDMSIILPPKEEII